MNNYIKTILCLTIGAIALLICLLVFWKHAEFGQCFVLSDQQQKIIVIDNSTYVKMADKKNLIIKNNDNEKRLFVSSWNENVESKTWVSIINNDLDIGSYQVFLKYSNLLW